MNIAHITASPNFGGPERQMLELARTLPQKHDARFLIASFYENGNALPFLAEAEKQGFPAYCFQHDTPHLFAALREMLRYLKNNRIDIILAHGHKARILGWLAARYRRIPIVGVSRGWTGQDRNVRIYERIDKWMHRRMDHVVCVSQGQANKVIQYGTPAKRITVIHNAVRTERFNERAGFDAAYRKKLEAFFPTPPKYILGDAGRLSPEKGFDVFINAAAELSKNFDIGLVIFGEGFLRKPLQEQINHLGLSERIKLAGFTDELDKYMPHFDLFVQSSHSEGLPNVLLEAMAAGTAVAATEVGGTNELVINATTGLLVPPNDVDALTGAVAKILSNDDLRCSFGRNGCTRVKEHFTFEAQAEAYWKLLEAYDS